MKGEGISAVILCGCSGIIDEKIDWEKVRTALAGHPARPQFRVDPLACGCENLAELAGWLRELAPARVVVAACSPREHERTFRTLLQEGGLNPFLLQMVNLREQGAWVTAEPAEATAKAVRLIGAALNRVLHQEPLKERRVPVRTDVAILGAGPAGMQAALTLARAGRRVTLIEREPFLGGLPVRYEELFPNLECGPCLLEPVQGELLHGPESELVRILTLAEVGEVKGSFGNWILTVKQTPRYLDEEQCIGCMLCAEVCPARRPHRWNPSGESPAVAPPFAGALPNLPFVAAEACLRLTGGECEECLNACPVPGTLDFEQIPRELTVEAGAIIVAIGAVEKQILPSPFAELPDVYSAYGFERLLAVSGPTGGELVRSDGSAPRSLAIVQCAGSFEQGSETDYCSGTCCRAALKYAHLAAAKLPGLTVTRLVREQSLPGIGAARQLRHQSSDCLRYGSFAGIEPAQREEGRVLLVEGREVPADLIVLTGPVVPGEGTAAAAKLLELATDAGGFLDTLHPLSGSCSTNLKGVFLAGACRGPCDIREAFASGTAAAGLALSELVEGRDLVVDPQVARVDREACAGCHSCLPVCPYRAINWNEEVRAAQVEELLCRGCGTCVASCPAGAIQALGFTRAALRAELEGVLS